MAAGEASKRNRSAAAIGLALLVVQNSASLMLLHKLQSRTERDRYEPLTVVILSEALKIVLSSIAILTSVKPTQTHSFFRQLHHGHAKSSIPAFLYTFAAAAHAVGAYHLDIFSYLVLSQVKVIVTPIFGMILLKQSLTPYQWACLSLMTCGIIVVQNGASLPASDDSNSQQVAFGVVSMLAAGLCVGFSGVYMEAVVKASDNLMARNMQLSGYSCVCAIIGLMWKSRSAFDDFFHGYQYLVWVLVGLQATGGFIVAWCIRVSGTIEKNYAQGLGFLLASTIPILSSTESRSYQFYFGVVLVLGGVFGSLWKGKLEDADSTKNDQEKLPT